MKTSKNCPTCGNGEFLYEEIKCLCDALDKIYKGTPDNSNCLFCSATKKIAKDALEATK